MTDATMSRIPAPPIMMVRMVWSLAAVFAPTMLMSMMPNATIIATISHEA